MAIANESLQPGTDLRDAGKSPAGWERVALAVIRLVPGSRSLGFSHRVKTAMHGSAWTLAGYGVSQLLRAASVFVLARRLLGPQAFGVAALATVFLSGLEMLTDLGVGMDVVQHRRGDDPVFINTAFLIQAVRGLILCGVAAALAYPFASFYHQPAIRWLAIVAAFSVGIRGFASGSIWTMTRHVKLGKLTALNVGCDAAGLLVAIAWSFVSPTAWALVMARVGSALVYTVGSHLMADSRPTLIFDRQAAREILLFGAGMFVSTATYFLGGEAERLILGKFVTVVELGCYSLALTVAALPSRALLQVTGQVFFPMISQSVREDRETAGRHYLRARLFFFVLSLIVGVGFIAYSHRVISILLGPKYLMAGWMLQLLGLRAAMEVFSAPTISLLLAHGEPKYSAVANTLRLILVSVGIVGGYSRYGIHGAIFTLAVVPVLVTLVVFPGVYKHLRKVFWVEAACFVSLTALLAVAFVVRWPFA
jgi:O-antigen/teichoic acid export membrane protein